MFVPLSLSVLAEVEVDMSLDYLRFFMWYLYLEDVACLFKALVSPGIHQLKPLKLPWYRAEMFDLSTLFPLSAIIGVVGSMLAAYVSFFYQYSYSPSFKTISVGGNSTCYNLQLVVV